MEIKYTGLIKRIQSIFVDTLLMILLMFISAEVFDKIGFINEENEALARGLVFFGVWGVYEPVGMTLGSTLGNYLVGIRVRKYDNIDKKINIFQAYGRFIIKLFLGWLSFITISMNKEKRTIHDLVAGTIVIDIKK